MSNDLIENNVIELFGIGKPKPRKRATRKRRKRQPDEEQFPVVCESAGEHGDLQGLRGVLTVDYVDGKPYEATFDPGDLDIENALIPIYGWRSSDDQIGIVSESSRWRFAVVTAD